MATAIANAESSLEARIREAVQAAVQYPAAARLMSLRGRARVRLDYQDGAVDGVGLAQSAGNDLLDRAAIRAVQEARYPKPPSEIAGHLLRLVVWVDFS
jgi:protein TonB